MKTWRPYTQMLGAPEPLPVTKAEGPHLYLKNGQKLLDGISSWWVITHAHCHPEIVRAIARQAQSLDQVVFANFSHDAAEELMDLLRGFLPPCFNRIFFSDNGSTSVEVAMKMAYQACAQSGKTERRKLLAFERAYHGDTCGAMSVTSDGTFTRAYADLRFEVIRCRQGSYLNEPLENWIGDFQRKIERYGNQIAAVIIEPLLQGAGGMVVWPTEALRTIQQTCREQGILVIFDEVMTGFGRTGTMFAFERVGIVPDFLCISKGLTGGALPLALTVTTENIYERFLSSRPERMLFHGHSFTGNAISCAAASANLRVFRQDKTLKKIQLIEMAHSEALEQMRGNLPLKDARVLGGVGAIELKDESGYGEGLSREIALRCMSEGLFIRPLGSVVYLMPPYSVSVNNVREAWQTIFFFFRTMV